MPGCPARSFRAWPASCAAASTYVENWALARSSTDYLAAESAPSPVQHYWSLSVEEQFYLFWPILIFALYWLGGQTSAGRSREAELRRLTWGLGAVFAVSLGVSAYLTRSNPPAAYFVTQTRVWELALGALVALAAHRGLRLGHRGLRAALAWLGLALIAYATLSFTESTSFPGLAALVPTVGTALVIAAACDDVAWSPRALLGWRPSQYLGDISYSVYLWHWPVVVIAPYALGEPVRWPVKLLLVAGVVVLAGLTKRYVEDTVRRSPALNRSLPKSFAVAVVSIALVVGSSLVVIANTSAARAADEAALRNNLSSTPCLGAAALRDSGCGAVAGPKLLNSPAIARDDKPAVYADDCWSNVPFTRHRVCTYGVAGGSTRVALLGNSHAGHWQPALEPLVKDRGWRMDTYLVSQCYTVTIPIGFKPATLSKNCTAWNRWAIDSIVKGKYDLVIMSDRTFQPLTGVSPQDKPSVAQRAYARTLKAFTDAGIRVIVLRDVPNAITEAPDCIDQHLDDVEACSTDRSAAVEPDPLNAAALVDRTGLVTSLDLTDRFCRGDRCHLVIGSLLAYFDHGHMTTTFARTLIPDIGPALDGAISRKRS